MRRLCDSYHTGAERKCAVTQKQSTQPEPEWQAPHRVTKSVYLGQGCLKMLAKPKMSREILESKSGSFLQLTLACLNKDVKGRG